MSEFELRLCPECGVPEEEAKGCLWLNSGVIVLAGDMMRRQCLIESENLDPIFALLEEMGITDIHDLVIEVARMRRAGRTKEKIPPEVRALVRSQLLSPDVFFPPLRADTSFRGFGDCELADFAFEGTPGDHLTIRVSNAYSKPLFLGAYVGLCEAFLDRTVAYSLTDLSADACDMTIFFTGEEGPRSEPFPEREYCHRDGDIELEKCSNCGSPLALSAFTWDTKAGIIRNNIGSRMVLLDPEVLDLIFKEVEGRAGEQAARAIVEAQRQFIRARRSGDHVRSMAEVRGELAVRGLNPVALRMRIENAACSLIVAGSMQALFDVTHDGDSAIEWMVSEKGDLTLEVTRSAN